MSPRTLAVTGASGMIGAAVVRDATDRGDRVLRLVRRPPAGPDEVSWDPDAGTIDAARLEGVDAVIHLAGEPIAGLWTRRRKRRIRESRVRGTEVVARALAGLERRPAALLVASGIHYYGYRHGDEPLDEASPPGDGFLAEVVRAWEAAADPARDAGIRVVHLRNAIVLDARRGMLAAILPIFRLGLGGPLGDGRQSMSWVTLRDAVAAIRFALERADLSGPVNVAAPGAVTNAGFTRTLARALRRPAPFRVPAWLLRRLPGGMGEELFLGGVRATPRRLAAAGFTFRDPELAPALARILSPAAG